MLPFTNWVSFRYFGHEGREAGYFDLEGPHALIIWSLCNKMMIGKNATRETTFVNLMAQTFRPTLDQGPETPLYARAIDHFGDINRHPDTPCFVGLAKKCALELDEDEDDEISFVIDEKLWIQPTNRSLWERYLQKTYGGAMVSEGIKLSYEFFKRSLATSEHGAMRDACDILLGLLHNIWVRPEHYFLCAISCVGEQIKKNTATLDLVASLLYCAKFDMPVKRLLELSVPSKSGLGDFVNPERLGPMRILSSKSTWKYPRFRRLIEYASQNRILFFPNGDSKQKRATVAFLLEELCLDEHTNDWITGGELVHFKGSDEPESESKSELKSSKSSSGSKTLSLSEPSVVARNTATHVREMIRSVLPDAGKKQIVLLSPRNKSCLGTIHLNMNVLGGYLPQSGHGTSFLGNAVFDGCAISSGFSGPVQLKTAHIVYALLKRAFDAMPSARRLFRAQVGKEVNLAFLEQLAQVLRDYINESLRELALWPP